ncbi:phosphohydrolase [Sporichthya brevicatena]|uniref:Phosphohydrolase n=1 Tax=Sporichthya brevicatena TaxID=171442 RepID=A0ABN1GYU7_9ACTN
MAAPEGIDYDWARATGGVLTRSQSRALFPPLLRSVAKYPGVRLRLATGRRGTAQVDLDAFVLPDSTLAKETIEHATEVLSPCVLQHSWRTFWFGLAIAEHQRRAVDPEQALIASLLHDITLETPTPGRCFALTGAEQAEAFLLAHGADPAFSARVGAEICGHITVGALEDVTSPGGFVSAGAFTDVAGSGLELMPAAYVDDVLARHPRLGWKKTLRTSWTAQTAALPGGRQQWLTRWALLPTLARIAPFPE